MKSREIGKSGIKVSEISLGCWTLGGRNWVNGNPNGWADVDEAEAAKGVELALASGVNHFDNADVYGNGRSERMLARILGARGRQVVIASKVGHFPGTAGHAYEPAHIRHQCEQSLINLKREALDIYYFHHGDFGPGDRYLADAVVEMRKLVKEGKVRAVGLSAYSDADFERLIPVVEPDVLQSFAFAGDIRFIKEGSPVRKLMDARGIRFVAFSPLMQGLLLGKYDPTKPPSFDEGDIRKGDSKFKPEGIARINAKVEKLKARFGASQEELARVALQYLLSFPCVCCAIPGFRNEAQVRMNLAGAGRPLSPEEAAFVTEVFG